MFATKRDPVALVHEEPLEQREDDERAGVADVDAAVDRRPARVDARRVPGRAARAAAPAPVRVSWRRISRTVAATLAHRRQAGAALPRRVRRSALGCAAVAGSASTQFAAATRSTRRSARSPSATSAPTPGFDATYHDPPRRPRAHLGGPLHRPRRPRAQGRHPPPARRRHRHRRRDLAALRAGEFSGVEAFQRRLLDARGDLDHASRFEGLFRLPGGRPPLLRDPRRPGRAPPRLDADHGRRARRAAPPRPGRHAGLVLRHRRGAQPRGYRVHALDLPGFGSSGKPRSAPTTRAGSPRPCSALMDALEIERAHLVGNSMGGRVAIEVGLVAPERVRALGAAVPRRRLRQARPAPARAAAAPRARPAAPRAPPLDWSRASSGACSTTATWSTPRVADLVVDEFQRIYPSRRRAAAFLASARNIYLERAVRPRRLLPAAGRPGAARAVRLGHARPARSRPRFAPPRRASGCPSAEQVVARRLRPRAAGRAARGDQRAAAPTSSRARGAAGATATARRTSPPAPRRPEPDSRLS